jgi:hypothetical protein
MRFFAPVAVGFGILFGPLVAVVRADLSPEEVRASIQRGVGYLKGTQKPDGAWPDYLGPSQHGGVTCLCTLALLNAGVDLQEEHVQNAMQYIRKLRTQTTYVVSLQTMVLCRAEPEKDQVLIGRNVALLEQWQNRDKSPIGAWSYPGGRGDNSNSQFALLALYEAERAAEAGRIHVQVHRETWERAKAYWTADQNPNGSWGYYEHLDGTGSMTCAGISSLVIASDVIHQPDARVVGDSIQCCPPADEQERDRVQDGIEWLRRNYTVESNPGQRGDLWHLYFLYGLERACRLTNRRFIGDHDWYREGTAYLIKTQGSEKLYSGAFRGIGHAEGDDDCNIATSLALLFLSKGRRPIILAKLKHGSSDDWNPRRNDINNLTIYVEAQWKRDLSWQIIDLEAASVDDLLQAPVLYYSGSRSPLPDTPQKQQELAQKLRDYLDRGGFLLAEADCCSTGFDAGFRELMRLVFPEEEYRLKMLDPSHPIWHAEQLVSAEGLRPLLGIDFGCRTSVVYAPAGGPDGPRPSLSCLWELSRAGRDTNYSQKVQAQIDAARAIGINVLAYATNRELPGQENKIFAPASPNRTDTVVRGRLDIAKLKHPGGCDAAPLALANLMEAAAEQLKIRVNPHPVLLDIRDDALFDYPVVFMHGRNAFRLTDEERERLGTYLKRGGLLFADAICSSAAFEQSFRREMSAILPKNALKSIGEKDPIWTAKYGGFDLSRVTRRDPQPGGATGPLRVVLRKVPPDLDGVTLDGHYAVIFSRFDISCALEKHASLECRGYTPEDAARIGLNVLLYATQQ